MRNRLRPDSNDPHYIMAKNIHDYCCVLNCKRGLDWQWYDDIVKLLEFGYTSKQIVEKYIGLGAA